MLIAQCASQRITYGREGHERYVISRNPVRYDQEGFELQSGDDDDEADALAAEEDPYHEVKLEGLFDRFSKSKCTVNGWPVTDYLQRYPGTTDPPLSTPKPPSPLGIIPLEGAFADGRRNKQDSP